MRNCIVCGHSEESHKSESDGYPVIRKYGSHWCQGCRQVEVRPSFHTFKLDNLSYIEDLAKERGLM